MAHVWNLHFLIDVCQQAKINLPLISTIRNCTLQELHLQLYIGMYHYSAYTCRLLELDYGFSKCVVAFESLISSNYLCI